MQVSCAYRVITVSKSYINLISGLMARVYAAAWGKKSDDRAGFVLPIKEKCSC